MMTRMDQATRAEDKRPVTLDTMAHGHFNAQKTFLNTTVPKLSDMGEEVRVLRNDFGRGVTEISVDELKRLAYNSLEDVRNEIKQSVREELASGEYSRATRDYFERELERVYGPRSRGNESQPSKSKRPVQHEDVRESEEVERPLESLVKDLSDELLRRYKSGVPLPAGVGGKTEKQTAKNIGKYLDAMPESHVRDWHSTIFDNRQTESAEANKQAAPKLRSDLATALFGEATDADAAIDESAAEPRILRQAAYPFLEDSDFDADGNVKPEVEKEIAAERAKIEKDAKADGTWLKAPNGKDSNLNPAQWVDVRTKRFKQWFGDWQNDPENASYMVDANREPQVFYHRSDGEFEAFDINKHGSNTDAGWLGAGFYFYGDETESYGYGDNRYEVFLNIREPYYAEPEDNERLIKANDPEVSKEFADDLKDQGYDGVYYNGDLRQETVAFEPNQIKSATENVGTYSNNRNSILKSARPSGEPLRDRQIFGNYVDRFVAGELDKSQKAGLVLSSTPSVFQKLGAKNLPFALRYIAIKKVLRDKHDITPDVLKGIPGALQDPIAIVDYLDKRTGKKGFRVFTDLVDTQGR